jgi:hypothetical protein
MSKIEVNQISSQCGSTLTIGQSGDTVTLASGATQSGFGRTGTVDWCTTAKTSPFTAVNGDGFFVNTTSGAITVTLPATPTAGDIIALKDYGATWDTNNVTLCNNGSLINGVCATATLNTEGQSVTLIYVDATKGWQDIQDSTSQVSGLLPAFVTATGGTIITCGDFKIHTFTGSGTFCVSCAGNILGSNTVDYLVVAGGGGGGGEEGGGGGAGGYRESFPNPATGGLPVSVQGYPITVGGGGTGQTSTPAVATSGSNSIFSTITSAGGGRGGGETACYQTGSPGGSGGGGHGDGTGSPRAGGTGNTPPVSPPQGNDGGAGIGRTCTPNEGAGGGGGATTVGANGSNSPGSGGTGGPGGAGATSSIDGTPTARGGGGGGAATAPGGVIGTGGLGGGGDGTKNNTTAQAGSTNTGGGGGGGGGNGGSTIASGGAGGSGIVIIRYKFQ